MSDKITTSWGIITKMQHGEETIYIEKTLEDKLRRVDTDKGMILFNDRNQLSSIILHGIVPIIVDSRTIDIFKSADKNISMESFCVSYINSLAARHVLPKDITITRDEYFRPVSMVFDNNTNSSVYTFNKGLITKLSTAEYEYLWDYNNDGDTQIYNKVKAFGSNVLVYELKYNENGDLAKIIKPKF